MDGLLIDSEDKYTECTNIILGEYGKGPLSWDVKIKLQGRLGPEAQKIMIDAYDLPMTPEELHKRLFEIQETLWPTCKFLPGALELLQYCHANKIPIALALGSYRANLERKTAHLQEGFQLFGRHMTTGDDPRLAGRGKPQPDIWHLAIAGLNQDLQARGERELQPLECLVFEDGVPGVQAGIAAGCPVIWVPHPSALQLLDGKEKDILPAAKGEILLLLQHLDKHKYGL